MTQGEEESETSRHEDETSFLPWILPAAYCQPEAGNGQTYFQLAGKCCSIEWKEIDAPLGCRHLRLPMFLPTPAKEVGGIQREHDSRNPEDRQAELFNGGKLKQPITGFTFLIS